jgi:hypothetical protein
MRGEVNNEYGASLVQLLLYSEIGCDVWRACPVKKASWGMMMLHQRPPLRDIRPGEYAGEEGSGKDPRSDFNAVRDYRTRRSPFLLTRLA